MISSFDSFVMPDEAAPIEDVRARIVNAAAGLIATGGRDAATTRAVATAASVQAPAIYRLFGDKRGLLDAVADHGLAAYVAQKAQRQPHADPVQDLRRDWDMHVEFCLAHPGLFAIMSEPHSGPRPVAVTAGLNVLRTRIRRIALTGRLRVSEERALAMFQSVCIGTVLTLLREPVERRDLALSDAAREAVMAAITANSTATMTANTGANSAAAALRASLDQTTVLTAGERQLLEELLKRIADSGSSLPGRA